MHVQAQGRPGANAMRSYEEQQQPSEPVHAESVGETPAPADAQACLELPDAESVGESPAGPRTWLEPDLSLKLVQELEGHSDRVWSLAWSPTSGLLASCSGDKTVRIWEKQSPNSAVWICKGVLDESHNRTVRSCQWSPDGRLLATASFDATVGIWENEDGQFKCLALLEGHENEVKSVAWNSSGGKLATCSRDKHLWIWEKMLDNEFECISVLSGHTQDVKMVTWHPREDTLVSSSYDDSIKIWKEDVDGEDWECVQTLGDFGQGHTSTVWAVSFNNHGDRLVSCSDDLTLMIWDTAPEISKSAVSNHIPWKHLYTITGYHDRTIFSVHWSRTTGLIASGGADDCIRVFSEEDFTHESAEVNRFAMVAKVAKAHKTDVNCVQWHPSNPRLLASASDDGNVKLWELVGDFEWKSSD